jgi:ABC-2 type transport system permease protein
MLRKALAFLKKDFFVESSYRFLLVINLCGIVVSLLGYFFIDKLFGHRMAPDLQEFGVNYFSYVLLSTAFFGYIGVGMGSFAERIQTEQMEGTLESIFLTPTRMSTILFSLALWNLVIATIDMAVYVLLGIFLFKINFANINVTSAAVILLLTIVSFGSLGMLSASFVMVFKRGNPAGWIISSLEGLVGGVYFPVTVLPQWLQIAANFFPITYAIRAFQLSVYRGYSVIQLSREIGILLLFCFALLPLSLIAFRRAIDRARREGSLAQH